MQTGYSVVYRMTQTEFNAGAGIGLVGGFIEIVNALGDPLGPMYITGIAGGAPVAIGGGDDVFRLATPSIAQWSAVVDVDGVHCAHADATSIATCGKLVGIAANAANTGDDVQFITHGDIINYAGLAVGPVYLSTSGALTSVVPTSGVFLYLGYVAATNIFVVEVREPIVIT
jgi:hypothetical protein